MIAAKSNSVIKHYFPLRQEMKLNMFPQESRQEKKSKHSSFTPDFRRPKVRKSGQLFFQLAHIREGIAKLASRAKFSDFFVGSTFCKMTYPIGQSNPKVK